MLRPFIISFLLVLWAPAAQVFFSSSVFQTNLDSEGSALTGDWVFALGAFNSGFSPTRANRSEWADHWTTAKASTYEPEAGFFSGEYQFFSNAAPFQTTGQGYIWGYNCTGEWILVTNPEWNWPNVFNPIAIPSNWTINNASVAIVGARNSGEVHMRTESGGGDFKVPALSYASWRDSFFNSEEVMDPQVSGSAADPDGDGHSNLMEYAQGTDPRDPANVDPGSVIFVERNGRLFPALEFKISGKTEKVDLVVESSTDLNDWEGASNNTLAFDNGDPLKQVFQSVVPAAGTPRRFFRIVAIPDGNLD